MGNTVYQPHKSSLGEIDANYIAVACYGAALIFSTIPFLKFVAWLAPLVIYILEKKSVLVKFHAVQALILNAIGAVLSLIAYIVGKIIVAAITPDTTDTNYWLYYYSSDYAKDLKTASTVAFLFGLLAWIIILGIGVFQVLSAINAYKYSEYKIPVIGGIANKVSEKLSKINFGGTNSTTPPPAQGYTPPAQQWTPPAQGYTPPAQPYTPPAQPAQQWTPPAQPAFDTQTGQPIAPPPVPPAAPPAQPMFDTQIGQPIAPPPAPPAQPKFDTETGLPINPPQE